jgi:hypothetical protein
VSSAQRPSLPVLRTELTRNARGGLTPALHDECRQDLRAKDKDGQVNEYAKTGVGCRRRSGPRRVAAMAVVLAGAALLAVACSSGGSPASGSAASPAQGNVQKMAVFASCMRSHGEKNFYFANPQGTPSPSATGAALAFRGYIVLGINPHAAPFPAALKACKHLLPGGGPQPVSQKQLSIDLKFAACMRSHGYPAYPDPDVQNGQLIQQPLPASIDTSSPRFQAAAKSCGMAPVG